MLGISKVMLRLKEASCKLPFMNEECVREKKCLKFTSLGEKKWPGVSTSRRIFAAGGRRVSGKVGNFTSFWTRSMLTCLRHLRVCTAAHIPAHFPTFSPRHCCWRTRSLAPLRRNVKQDFIFFFWRRPV